jgi:hypothetical protein
MHTTNDETEGVRGIRALSDGDAKAVEIYRRYPHALAPPAAFLPIIDTLAERIVTLERTVEHLRAMNRSLSDRRRD